MGDPFRAARIPDVLLDIAKRPKIPRPPRKTATPSGPKWLGLERDPIYVGGPGEPPEHFLLRGNVSKDEWPPYWGFTKILGAEGPAGGWYYQKSEMGGRHLPGGSVLDFSIEDRYPKIAVRVQTERFHIGVGSAKRAYDYEQKIFLSQQGFVVHDIFSYQYLHDPSGQACIRLLWGILNGLIQPDPALSGSVSVRPA